MATSDETFYQRHLPHYQPDEATFFVTFRLFGSLPKEVIESIQEKEVSPNSVTRAAFARVKKEFEQFDGMLERNSAGPFWLRQPKICELVREAIHFRDGKDYDLLAYCIMPNHVHMVFSLEGFSDTVKKKVYGGRDAVPTYRVTSIVGGIKKHSALKANKMLGRTGPFWQGESYDHVVRDDESLEQIIEYVMENPVSANLVKDWSKWKGTYVRPGLVHL